MPPRKRAESKPEPPAPEPQEELAPATEDPADSKPEPAADDTKNTDVLDNPDDNQAEAADGEQPCAECFPNGWPTGGTRVGCVHGNWARD